MQSCVCAPRKKWRYVAAPPHHVTWSLPHQHRFNNATCHITDFFFSPLTTFQTASWKNSKDLEGDDDRQVGWVWAQTTSCDSHCLWPGMFSIHYSFFFLPTNFFYRFMSHAPCPYHSLCQPPTLATNARRWGYFLLQPFFLTAILFFFYGRSLFSWPFSFLRLFSFFHCHSLFSFLQRFSLFGCSLFYGRSFLTAVFFFYGSFLYGRFLIESFSFITTTFYGRFFFFLQPFFLYDHLCYLLVGSYY